jgi:glycosyltransferase involved in cell wall biosynthesis
VTIRVLHIIESFGAGSLTSMLQYVRGTPELEHHIAYRPRPGEHVSDGELALFPSIVQMPTSHLGVWRSIRAAVRRIDPDVLHAHSTFAGGYVRLAVRSRPGCRIVYTPHCFAFERLDVRPVVRAAFRLVERVLSHNCDALAACSEREATLGQGWGYERVVVVPNVARSREHPEVVQAGRPTVVTIGRAAPQKDPNFYVSAVRLLRSRRPDVQAVWIGSGDAAFVSELVSAGVTVTGWLTHRETLSRLAESTVYVHTGAWEGFPMSVLEANEVGRAIVVRLIPPFFNAPHRWVGSDPQQVADAIVDALEHLADNRAAWSAYLRDNTAETQRARLLGIYESLAKELDR